MVDTGLACHLLGVDEDKLRQGSEIVGRVLENFVVLARGKQDNRWLSLQNN
jgi:hypothetical protein